MLLGRQDDLSKANQRGGENVSEPTTGTLAKRKFVFDLAVGGPDQDVINKLEGAKVYRDLIVRAVRQYREEGSSE